MPSWMAERLRAPCAHEDICRQLRRNARRRHILATLSLGAALVCGPVYAQTTNDYDALIMRAREGDTGPALEALRTRVAEYPEDLRAAYDRIAIAGWAGRDEEVIAAYQLLPGAARADADTIETVAKAYRNRQQWNEALALYREGVALAPDHMAFQAGEVLVLADLQDAGAIAKGRALVGRFAREADAHAALGYAYTRLGFPFEALTAYERAVGLAPARADLRRERVFAHGRAGLVGPARTLAEREAGLFTASERRRIEASAAAELVRLAPMPARGEAARFIVADRAIARLDDLIGRWQAEGAEAQEDIHRARLDRINAYHARVRMQDVVDEYEALKTEGVVVPPYVLIDVASAYLYLRHPEVARDLYREVIAAGDPDLTSDAEIGLFYALNEGEQIEEAIAHIDDVNTRRPIWLYAAGQPERLANAGRLESETAASSARLFADDLPEAERRLSRMTAMAPGNVGIRTSRASVWRSRAWPRRAEADLKIAETQAPRALSVEVEQGLTALDLSEWRQAEALSDDVIARFPENLSARRLARLWEVHNKPELRIEGEYGFGGGSPLTGNGDRGLQAALYSPPIAYDWRVFAGAGHAGSRFPEGKGDHDWAFAGIDYRVRDLTAEAEVSRHRYGDGGKLGGRLAVAVDLDDHSQVGVAGEILSRDTPLRALRNGVRADGVNAFYRWRAHERKEVRLSAQALWFNDGNERLTTLLQATQRVHTRPHFRVDAGFDLSASFNSRSNVAYYSPGAEVAALPAATFTHIIHRRYQTVWDHSLTLGAGGLWQRDFGTGAILSAGYRQRFTTNDVLTVSAGINALYRPYDGDYEPDFRASFNLTYRF